MILITFHICTNKYEIRVVFIGKNDCGIIKYCNKYIVILYNFFNITKKFLIVVQQLQSFNYGKSIYLQSNNYIYCLYDYYHNK